MIDRDEWLRLHTFYCQDIKGRITPEACEENRHKEGYLAYGPCLRCTDFEERRKGVGIMALSENVKRDTIQAILKSKTQEEAARMLGISAQGLYFRIRNNAEIEKVAIERGMRRPAGEKKPGPSSIKGQFDKKADLPISGIPEKQVPSNEPEKSYTPEQKASIAPEMTPAPMSTTPQNEPDLSTEDRSDSAKPPANYSENIPGKESSPESCIHGVKIIIEFTCDPAGLPDAIDRIRDMVRVRG